MKKMFLAVALSAMVLPASASVLLYDFEGSTEGFGPNGGLFPVTNDTVGATSGTGSLKVEVPSGAFFVGALNGTTLGAPLFGDPPGLTGVTFDLTIVDQFQGAFADIGITIFGASQPGPGQVFGQQAQFADITSLGVAPGTYSITLLLDSATNPLNFAADQTYGEIFGDFGTGPDTLIATGFQFFVSKSTDAPVTFFIDNVRALPEPMSLGMLGAAFGCCVATRRRR